MSSPSPPSSQPSSRPSSQPSSRPSSQPSIQPSCRPSSQPSLQPSCQPSSQPSSYPTNPTGQPSRQPSRQPSSHPTFQPTSFPTPKSGILANPSMKVNHTRQIFLIVIAVLIGISVAAIFVWRYYRKNRRYNKQQTGQRGDAYQGHRGSYTSRNSNYNGSTAANTTTPRKPARKAVLDDEQISPLAQDQVSITIDNNRNANTTQWKAFNDDDNNSYNKSIVRNTDKTSRSSRRLNGPEKGQFNKPMINIKSNPIANDNQIPMIPIVSSSSAQSFPSQPQTQRAINIVETDSLLFDTNKNAMNTTQEHEDDNVMF